MKFHIDNAKIPSSSNIQNKKRYPSKQQKQVDDSVVYFLWQNGDIVYIGMSQDLKTRICVHRTNKAFDEYSFITCTTHPDALYLEDVLIKKFKPKYNNGKCRRECL